MKLNSYKSFLASALPSCSMLAALLSLVLLSACSGGGGGDETALLTNTCSQIGLTTKSLPNTRIINGTECAQAGSPVVKVNVRLLSGATGLCSGTLLTPTTVLTAAHCFFSPPTSVSVEVNGRRISARSYRNHPEVRVDPNSQVVLNDVALLELTEGFPGVPTLPILGTRQVRSGDLISVYGYGQTESGASGFLQSGQMRISDVNETHIGARFNGEGSNPCFGDSGGPAIYSYLDPEGRVINAVIGVVSSGEVITCLEGDRTLFANTTTSSIFNFITSNVSGVTVR